MRIEAAKEAIRYLPMTASVLASLRETARLFSTHYSTMIEGNRLTQEQVSKVLGKREHFPGRERDEKEVLGCRGRITTTAKAGSATKKGAGIVPPKRCDHQPGCRTTVWCFA